MITFIGADELKKKYEVYANFYTLQQADGIKYLCRNVADIFKIGHRNLEPNSLPEALIIMMNPGKCEPKNANFIVPEVSLKELEVTSKSLPKVPSKADNAQYQIMRLMELKNWNHVRILNLSDIKNSNGDDFKALLKDLKFKDNKHTHSIFSNERSKERVNLLNIRDNAPIILGWGTDKVLTELAIKCLSCIPLTKATGLNYSENLYYFPSPTLKSGKEKWLENILEII